MADSAFRTALAALLATIVLVGLIWMRPPPRVVQTGLDRLPVRLADYRGSEDSFPETINRELKADASLYRHYRGAGGGQLDLYVGYYGTAKGGRTSHNPYACLPGAGWAIVESRTVPVSHPGGGQQPVNYVQARRDGVTTLMLHWYQNGAGTVMSTGLHQNLERFRGRLLHNRSDGAFVQVTARAAEDRIPQTLAELQQFAAVVLRHLPEHWPVER